MTPDMFEWGVVVTAALVTTVTTVYFKWARPIWAAQKKARQDQRQFLADWNGRAGDKARRVEPTQGFVERMFAVEDRQVTIADDVTAVKSELSRNGGTSVKDAAFSAARSAEAAAASAEIAARIAERIESKLDRHMQNGLDIMEVGIHNDGQIITAIENLGGSVGDYRPFPPVDIGD